MNCLASVAASAALLIPSLCLAQNWHGVPFEIGSAGWGPVGTIYDLKTCDPDGAGPIGTVLVIAGSFSTIKQHDGTSVTANNICYWDGCKYQRFADLSLPTGSQGFGGPVYCLETYGGELYAGGDFGTADGSTVNSLAKWNGSDWVQAGGGVFDNASIPTRGIVYSMKTFGSGSGARLYVGGSFRQTGSTNAYSLATWDGSTWTNLNALKCVGTTIEGTVRSLATDGSSLIVGGDFSSVGGAVAADAAWYTGSSWQGTSAVYGLGENLRVPPGCTGCSSNGRTVLNAVGVNSSTFWAGGGTSATKLSYDGCNPPSPETQIDGMANSTGTTWTDGSGAGAGPDMNLYSEFDVIGGDLYAAGTARVFPTNAPTTSIHSVCKWTGSAWAGVGDFLGGPVHAIEQFQGEIYVGGDFASASSTHGGSGRDLPGPLARFTVQCSEADVGKAGGVAGADGYVDNNDATAFTNLYLGGCLAADIGVAGGLPGRDGVLNNNDWIAFYNWYFSTCP